MSQSALFGTEGKLLSVEQMMEFSPDVQSWQLAGQHWAFKKLFKGLLETNKSLN